MKAGRYERDDRVLWHEPVVPDLLGNVPRARTLIGTVTAVRGPWLIVLLDDDTTPTAIPDGECTFVEPPVEAETTG